MPTASPTVHVRREEPIPPGTGATDAALTDEAGRWGMYGEVIRQHVDDQGRPVSEVAPRKRGSLIALRGQLDSRRNDTHTLVDPEADRAT